MQDFLPHLCELCLSLLATISLSICSPRVSGRSLDSLRLAAFLKAWTQFPLMPDVTAENTYFFSSQVWILNINKKVIFLNAIRRITFIHVIDNLQINFILWRIRYIINFIIYISFYSSECTLFFLSDYIPPYHLPRSWNHNFWQHHILQWTLQHWGR